MRQALGGFGLLAGATYPFRVLAVFKRTPHLWRYMIMPILLNFVLGICLYMGLLFFGWQAVQNLMVSLSNWLDTLIANLPEWLGVLDYLIIGLGFLLYLLLVVVLLLLTGFLLTQFGVLLGAPWYGQLSEQLEKIRTGELHTVEVGIFRDLWRAILFELKKLVLMAVVGLPLLLLNWVPGIGTLASAIGGLTLTATIVCLDFLDAPLERRRLHFREKLGIVFGSLPASASFSLVCLGLISVPLLNLLTIPLCVASGTLFFCDRVLPKLPNAPSQAKSDESS
ncbi:MAG: EI24 domain-containing protein [Xenococcaceae cyanobacterium]